MATEPQITKVRVFNWDNNQVLKGDFNRTRSRRDADGVLIIGISNCRIENFIAGESYFDVFGMAAVVYTPYVPVQRSKEMTSGIIRDANFAKMNFLKD